MGASEREVDIMLRRVSEMFGFKVRAADGDAGAIRDVYFDDGKWTVRYLVVDTGGWLGGRKVLLSPVSVLGVHWDSQELRVDLTKSQVESSPHIDLDQPVSRQQIVELHEYYGWPAYWGASMTMGTATPGVYPMIMAGVDEVEQEMREEGPSEKYRGDPHHRSTRAVSGYDIEARDGEIGHVEDFLLSDKYWIIRYLLVDTRDWLPGRKVLIPPLSIERVDWAETAVRVSLTRDQVESSPEYDPSKPLERSYEVRLYEHYGRRGYWRKPTSD
ncbi:MAG: PRC-barrel domain-containing protein [Chloroflexota bacterium]